VHHYVSALLYFALQIVKFTLHSTYPFCSKFPAIVGTEATMPFLLKLRIHQTCEFFLLKFSRLVLVAQTFSSLSLHL